MFGLEHISVVKYNSEIEKAIYIPMLKSLYECVFLFLSMCFVPLLNFTLLVFFNLPEIPRSEDDDGGETSPPMEITVSDKLRSNVSKVFEFLSANGQITSRDGVKRLLYFPTAFVGAELSQRAEKEGLSYVVSRRTCCFLPCCVESCSCTGPEEVLTQRAVRIL